MPLHMRANRFRNRQGPGELTWEFDGGSNDDAWTWWCVQSGSGVVVRRSQRAFPSFLECVLDAVKQRVSDHQHAGEQATLTAAR